MATESSVRETMTVHQALCELKTLNKRILSATSSVNPIGVKEHSSQKVNGMTMSEFAALARSSHDSATDLIKRQVAIKSAINHYNATKMVTVAGKEYSIAQAIWLMNYGMTEQKQLLNMYTNMLNQAMAKIERSNGDELNRRAENAIGTMYGPKEKADPREYLTALEEYKTNHAMELVDPLNIRSVIANLEKEITSFEAGVDSAIQTANATTFIEISY